MKPEPMIEVQYGLAHPPLTARLVDLSPSHLYLGLEQPLPPGVDVLVRLRFPGEVQVVELAGQVMWNHHDTMFVEVESGAPGSIGERGGSAGELSVLSSFQGDGARERGRGVVAAQERLERRQYPRGIVGGRTKGWVNAIDEVSILDVSLGGALIEHTGFVRLESVSYVDLLLRGRKLRVQCRAVRSAVDRLELQPDGEEAVIYHTGVEFHGPFNGMRVSDRRFRPVDCQKWEPLLRGLES